MTDNATNSSPKSAVLVKRAPAQNYEAGYINVLSVIMSLPKTYNVKISADEIFATLSRGETFEVVDPFGATILWSLEMPPVAPVDDTLAVENARLRATLEFYADQENWWGTYIADTRSPMFEDWGDPTDEFLDGKPGMRARAALVIDNGED